MNAMILLAQGAMNMADSLATANPVLTEVNAPEMNMLDMAVKGGWIMIVLGVLSVICFYILFERNYMIRKAGKEIRKNLIRYLARCSIEHLKRKTLINKNNIAKQKSCIQLYESGTPVREIQKILNIGRDLTKKRFFSNARSHYPIR